MQTNKILIVGLFALFTSSSVFGAEDCSLWPTETAPVFPTTMTKELCDGTIDTGAEWGNYERELSLNSHNYYRGQLAHGCSQLPDGGYAPPARNMKKLTYNCSMEKIAKIWSDKCIWEHSPGSHRDNAGENMYMVWNPSDNPDKTISSFWQQAQSWWAELIKYGGGINATNTDINSSAVGHWDQMAWAKTYSVGCSVTKCANGTGWKWIGVCNYWPTRNGDGPGAYDIGTHCKSNEDCTLPLWRTCDTELGLCEPSPPENEPTFPCNGENTGVQFQDNMRKFVENKINELRSELANGKTVKSDGTFAPKAVNMPKVTYNCTLEKIAQNKSESCPPFKYLLNSDDETVFQELNRDREELPDKYIPLAFDTWWSEFKADNASVNITSASTKYSSWNYRNWAQLASSKTVSIGCGYSVCMNQYQQSMHTVVCKYYQNVTKNAELYTVGNPCSQDSECTLPGYSFCDVALGLCSSTEVLPEAPTTTTTTTLKPETTATNKEPETTTILPTEKTTEIDNTEKSTTTSQPANGGASTTVKPEATTSSQASMTPTSCPESTPGTPSPCQLPEETTSSATDAPWPATTPKYPTTSNPACPPEGGTWSEWSEASCNDTCGLCGIEVQIRECISEVSGGCPCIGETIKYGTTRCGDPICSFPRPSCCSAYAKRAVSDGTIKCIPI